MQLAGKNKSSHRTRNICNAYLSWQQMSVKFKFDCKNNGKSEEPHAEFDAACKKRCKSLYT